MSDHPEVPRVEFDDSGYSMNKEEAVERFRHLLDTAEKEMQDGRWSNFDVKVTIRPCDCDSDINGRDKHCPLHGAKA